MLISLLAATAIVIDPKVDTTASVQVITPVVEFPTPGLDDSAAYEGYRTRFYRDARGNVVQVYINQRQGRVVTLLANSANESASFTARDSSGAPAQIHFASDSATVDAAGRRSTVSYALTAPRARIEIGRFLLGSMRLERDFQYHEGHLQPFEAPSIAQPELTQLIANVERLPATERARHLRLLNATSAARLSERLRQRITTSSGAHEWTVSVAQPTFDGRNTLLLRLHGETGNSSAALRDDHVVVTPRGSDPIRLRIAITTDAAPLTPLDRSGIFSDDFLAFYELTRQAGAEAAAAAEPGGQRSARLRFALLERQMRSLELMSFEEKLFAGLPNYATYFGRDMLMSALMMQPIWTGAMAEHVIGSVLRKLNEHGEVSHEEALGGQAIRENAAEYNAQIDAYLRLRSQGETHAADTALASARGILRDLQAVRENYVMADDDFQFPVLVARYLSDPRVSRESKLAFLTGPARPDAPDTRLALLLRNLAYVARAAEPYAREQLATNLVAFPQRDTASWFPGSWRDSNAGYGGGRFAMDINVIWVPMALEALGGILLELRGLGFAATDLTAAAPVEGGESLRAYISDSSAVHGAVRAWSGTARHFEVRIPADVVRERAQAKLEWLPAEERAYWTPLLMRDTLGIRFPALSLDAAGRPIPVVNSDPATRLFLQARVDPTGQLLEDVRPLLRAFPVGLFVAGLGPLVANDAYASPAVWENFRRDHYHGPRVVWGREVNLLLLGLANQLQDALRVRVTRPPGAGTAELDEYIRSLRSALAQTVAAVDQSGLKHAELWTYRIEQGRLLPVRYPISTDIQLWNLTELAVQYALWRLSPEAR